MLIKLKGEEGRKKKKGRREGDRRKGRDRATSHGKKHSSHSRMRV
jgi:hypothetical protein